MSRNESKRRAVVSGLGPNGVAATLELLNLGFEVTAVEKRMSYTRPIHLLLRSTYMQDVHRLSPELHRRLMKLATPIVENVRKGWESNEPVPNHILDRRSSTRDGDACPIWSRLSTPPERHVRLDNTERLYYRYLKELETQPDTALSLRRGSRLQLEPTGKDYYRVLLQLPDESVEDLGTPDLVVIAEGGKSSTVETLGLENVRFSYPKYFMSAQVSFPYGPRTRRIDVEVRQLLQGSSVPTAVVGLWASGHGDSQEGTWVVIEVPEALLGQESEQAEEYFINGALLLLEDACKALSTEQLRDRIRADLPVGALSRQKRAENLPGMEAAAKLTFAGTFKFEQQCLRHPAAGKNVVVLGDAAGMGHHALSSGLELGACDLQPLSTLCRNLEMGHDESGSIAAYAEAVFRSRLKLLGLGMNEYYPNLAEGKLAILHRAAEVLGEESE